MNFKFLNDKNVQDLFSVFKESKKNLYIVGGAVRNEIAGLQTKDIDFCTTANPERIITILEKNNIKYDDIAKKFGTIRAMVSDKMFEITTLRKEVYKNSRFPKVYFIGSIRRDSLRRDFTMNAIYINRDGKIYDFHNGCDDIQNKIVRFIGKPQKSVDNDPLRILRYFRFCAEYNFFNFDKESFETCVKNFNKTFKITKKKFNQEYEKIMMAPGKNIILDKWEEFGILEKVNNFLKD